MLPSTHGQLQAFMPGPATEIQGNTLLRKQLIYHFKQAPDEAETSVTGRRRVLEGLSPIRKGTCYLNLQMRRTHKV